MRTSEYPNVFGAAPVAGDSSVNRKASGCGRLRYSLMVSGHAASGRSAAVGRSLSLGGASYTVLGIMPPAFVVSPAADVLLPLQLHVDPADRANDYHAIARLRPGVSIERARQDMQQVNNALRSQFGKDVVGRQRIRGRLPLSGLAHARRAAGARGAWVCLAFRASIACANVETCCWHALPAGSTKSPYVRRLAQRPANNQAAADAKPGSLRHWRRRRSFSGEPHSAVRRILGTRRATRSRAHSNRLACACLRRCCLGCNESASRPLPCPSERRLGIQTPLRDSGTRTATSGTRESGFGSRSSALRSPYR